MHDLHTPPSTKFKLLNGAALQHQIARGAYTLTQLALVGHGLETGELALTGASPRQAAAISTVSMSLLRTVRLAPLIERMALEAGAVTVKEAHQARLRNERLEDQAIDQFVTEIGVDRIWNALERATAPSRPAAMPKAFNIAVNPNGNGAAHFGI